ncbi:hypothetical protein PILCRDRAFT_16722 [Piloderma croceum F 1598]|uniref:Uncharacterized protein n=1 Tax=Piloderma croceum (strain F 1598) TaxID=765440 RepID=A0A0C3B3D3_PILCF|nr:hypothetical protein PILCRDRAFT_16722 [Piloderma croceum F 1598]
MDQHSDLEKLEEAILVQQGIVIEAQNTYNHVSSLELCAKGGGKRACRIVETDLQTACEQEGHLCQEAAEA